jgi:hypothetical protein
MITLEELSNIKRLGKERRDRYNIKHPGRAVALGRQRRFGISPTEFDSLMKKQNSLCAICGNLETVTWKGKVKKLAVDHDHITGKIRSLLCQKCNMALGSFNDSIELLEKAIHYLRNNS